MKVLILGPARSGTTTMTTLLGQHPSVEGQNYEPFHPSRYEQVGPEEQAKHLRQLFEEYDVVKCLHVQIPDDNLKAVLAVPTHVILMARRNQLKRAVSACLARTTKVWQPFGDKHVDYKTRSFPPLSLNAIGFELRKDARFLKRAELIRSVSEAKVIELVYEDFYLSGDPVSEALKLFESIGLDRPKKHRLDRLFGRTRLNDESTYARIENIREIEERFGSDRTGHIVPHIKM